MDRDKRRRRGRMQSKAGRIEKKRLKDIIKNVESERCLSRDSYEITERERLVRFSGSK